MICNITHGIDIDSILTQLPKNQGRERRHKDVNQAYNLGYQYGRSIVNR